MHFTIAAIVITFITFTDIQMKCYSMGSGCKAIPLGLLKPISIYEPYFRRENAFERGWAPLLF